MWGGGGGEGVASDPKGLAETTGFMGAAPSGRGSYGSHDD